MPTSVGFKGELARQNGLTPQELGELWQTWEKRLSASGDGSLGPQGLVCRTSFFSGNGSIVKAIAEAALTASDVSHHLKASFLSLLQQCMVLEGHALEGLVNSAWDLVHDSVEHPATVVEVFLQTVCACLALLEMKPKDEQARSLYLEVTQCEDQEQKAHKKYQATCGSDAQGDFNATKELMDLAIRQKSLLDQAYQCRLRWQEVEASDKEQKEKLKLLQEAIERTRKLCARQQQDLQQEKEAFRGNVLQGEKIVEAEESMIREQKTSIKVRRQELLDKMLHLQQEEFLVEQRHDNLNQLKQQLENGRATVQAELDRRSAACCQLEKTCEEETTRLTKLTSFVEFVHRNAFNYIHQKAESENQAIKTRFKGLLTFAEQHLEACLKLIKCKTGQIEERKEQGDDALPDLIRLKNEVSVVQRSAENVQRVMEKNEADINKMMDESWRPICTRICEMLNNVQAVSLKLKSTLKQALPTKKGPKLRKQAPASRAPQG